MRTNNINLAKPEKLSRLGTKAYNVIVDFLTAHKMDDTGGCKMFYSPKEWKDRQEEYGTNSELVVVYDGGYLYDILSGEFGWELSDELAIRLREQGIFMENCTSWYSAVYAI